MGMLLRRHYATASPVKPVEQTEAVSVEEMPKEDIEQVAITEEIPEEVEKPEKEEKPKIRKLTRKSK